MQLTLGSPDSNIDSTAEMKSETDITPNARTIDERAALDISSTFPSVLAPPCMVDRSINSETKSLISPPSGIGSAGDEVVESFKACPTKVTRA